MDSRIRNFIESAIPSVWALELLLQLAEHGDRAVGRDELVALLRASDAVVTKCGDSLVAAGLVVEEGADRLRYAPASSELSDLVEMTRALYRSRPGAVRRLIVGGFSGGLDAFADAFRLRKDLK